MEFEIYKILAIKTRLIPIDFFDPHTLLDFGGEELKTLCELQYEIHCKSVRDLE
jgi:hypothetical protein